MNELDVVNMALAKLGQPLLEQEVYEAGNSKAARSCRLFYPVARETVLRRHPWSFALEVFQSKGEDVGSGWAHNIPDESLRVIVLRDKEGRKVEHFTIAGRRIVCAEPWVYVSFILKEPVLEYWDALFTECVVLKLASLLAGALCQNPSLETDLMQKLEQVQFPKAITADAREVAGNENHPGLKNLCSSMLLRARK